MLSRNRNQDLKDVRPIISWHVMGDDEHDVVCLGRLGSDRYVLYRRQADEVVCELFKSPLIYKVKCSAFPQLLNCDEAVYLLLTGVWVWRGEHQYALHKLYTLVSEERRALLPVGLAVEVAARELVGW